MWKRDALNVRNDSASAQRHTEQQQRAIRTAIEHREFFAALDEMSSAVGLSQWRFIERAFPLMTQSERATCLHRVWCESKIPMSGRRVLSLFRAASLLPRTVPTALRREVRIYRGAWAADWRTARRRARNGLSWTTDRDVAVAFADLPLYAIERFLHRKENTTYVLDTSAGGLPSDGHRPA